MNSIEDIIRSFQKQNETNKTLFGLANFQQIAETIKKQNESVLNLASLNGIASFAKTIAQQKMQFRDTAFLGMQNFGQGLIGIQEHLKSIPLKGFTTTLSEIAKTNHYLSDRIAGFAASQIAMSNNLSSVAKGLTFSHLNNFNTFDVALQGISKSYLQDISRSHNWNDINIAENANNAITSATDELLENSGQVTLQDLDTLKSVIIQKLSDLLDNTITHRAKKFILDLMALVGFLFTIYGTYELVIDKSNQDVINETKNEFNNFEETIAKTINSELSKFHILKVATRSVALRKSPNKKSRIIDTIQKDQKVTVIDNLHKYFLITYFDNISGKTKSGFALKKYFRFED